MGWTRHTIDAVVCGDDLTSGRPAPDLIVLAMKLTAVEDAGRVANVGDTVLDLESAAPRRRALEYRRAVGRAFTRGALACAAHAHPSIDRRITVLRT